MNLLALYDAARHTSVRTSSSSSTVFLHSVLSTLDALDRGCTNRIHPSVTIDRRWSVQQQQQVQTTKSVVARLKIERKPRSHWRVGWRHAVPGGTCTTFSANHVRSRLEPRTWSATACRFPGPSYVVYKWSGDTELTGLSQGQLPGGFNVGQGGWRRY